MMLQTVRANVLQEILEIFPSPIYTLLSNKKKIANPLMAMISMIVNDR